MINIKPLKAYTDNYIWLLETNEEVSIIDPGDAKPVLDYLSKTNKNLKEAGLKATLPRIKILEIQREGKKPQKIEEFILGSNIKKGSFISNA